MASPDVARVPLVEKKPEDSGNSPRAPRPAGREKKQVTFRDLGKTSQVRSKRYRGAGSVASGASGALSGDEEQVRIRFWSTFSILSSPSIWSFRATGLEEKVPTQPSLHWEREVTPSLKETVVLELQLVRRQRQDLQSARNGNTLTVDIIDFTITRVLWARMFCHPSFFWAATSEIHSTWTVSRTSASPK